MNWVRTAVFMSHDWDATRNLERLSFHSLLWVEGWNIVHWSTRSNLTCCRGFRCCSTCLFNETFDLSQFSSLKRENSRKPFSHWNSSTTTTQAFQTSQFWKITPILASYFLLFLKYWNIPFSYPFNWKSLLNELKLDKRTRKSQFVEKMGTFRKYWYKSLNKYFV